MKKKLAFCLLAFIFPLFTYAQALPELNKVRLNKKAQFKDAEALVLKTTEFLLRQDLEKEKASRRKAGQFLMRWMNGTPDYLFYLEPADILYFENNTDYMLSFMAALTHYSIKHPQESRVNKFIGALDLVLPYLKKYSHKEDWSRELSLLMDKYDQAEMTAYIKQNYPATSSENSL